MIQPVEFTVHTNQAAHYKAVLDRLNRPRQLAPVVIALPEPEPEPEPEAPTPATWMEDCSPDTMEMYEKIINAPGWNAKVTATRMVEDVAAKHGLTVDDIMGPRRLMHIVAARYEAMGLVANTFRGWSLPVLGRFFGNRNHTSVLHALRMTGARGCTFPPQHRCAGKGA